MPLIASAAALSAPHGWMPPGRGLRANRKAITRNAIGTAVSQRKAARQSMVCIRCTPSLGNSMPPRLVPTSAMPMAVPRWVTNHCETKITETLSPAATSTAAKPTWIQYRCASECTCA
ncbi:hypothetical protein D3C81_1938000 [compost metagenome]